MVKLGGTWNVLGLVISTISLGEYFIQRPEQVYLFGFDVPNLVYLLFWGICLAGCLSSVYRAQKKV